jgi:hypothetical protein
VHRADRRGVDTQVPARVLLLQLHDPPLDLKGQAGRADAFSSTWRLPSSMTLNVRNAQRTSVRDYSAAKQYARASCRL